MVWKGRVKSPLSDALLGFEIGARIFLILIRNRVSVVMMDRISDIGSAMKSPFVPKFPIVGRISARGINRITFLSRARNIEILACPSAMKVCWQAHWMPKNRKPMV